MSKSRYISMKDDSFKALIGFILILLFIFAISSFFVNDGNNNNNNNSNIGGDGEEDNPNLIIFTVGNSTLQAESGMTWSQWLTDPKYNKGFDQNGEYITISTGAHILYLCMEDGTRVKLSDVILEGGVYYFSTVRPDPDPVVLDFYLVGFINGADYGSAYDYETIGDYKFVDGKLVVTFEAADNYVFVKTGDNANWFMASAYCTDTTVTLANTNIGTTEKLYVPGGVEITFTLVINEDDTLTLSYTAATSDPDTDIGGDGEGDNFNKIFFYIGSIKYFAENGMTWGEWIDSDYDSDRYVLFDNNISFGTPNGSLVYTFDGNIVLKDDLIDDGAIYRLIIPDNSDPTPDPDPDTGEDDNPNIITFTIGDDTLQAESGMTWSQWLIDHKDNIGFDQNGEYITITTGAHILYLCMEDGTRVKPSDEILEGGVYYFSTV